MTRAPHYPRLGLVLLVGLAIAWGVNWPMMKIVFAEFKPWTFRGFTCLAAGLMLLALARVSRVSLWPASGEWRRIAIASLFNVTSWHMLTAFGIMLLASGKASVLAFTMPLWAALIGVVFLGERMSGRRAIALALGLAGILVLVSRDLGVLGDAPLGVLFILAAAIGWAIATLYQKRQEWTISMLALAGWQLLIGGVPIILAIPLVEGLHIPQASPIAWLCTLYVVVVALVFAYFAWFKIVSLFPANVAAIGTLLTPVIGVLSGVLVLGEPFTWREMLALILVGSALALVLIVPAPAARLAPADD